MHPQPSSSRVNAVIGTSLATALIAITSDIAISAGVVRDVITAIGQHVLILGAIWRTQTPHTLNPECTKCQRSCRRVSRPGHTRFPALKDNAAIRSGCSGTVIY
jgi:hypothetical protein